MPITYKCPACGAAMEFDGKTQQLVCAHCGNQMEVHEYEEQYGKHMHQQERDSAQEQGNAATNQQMKIYHCQSCGAELVTDEYTSATICSFCGNPSLVQDRLDGTFEPQSVIPFRITKEQAKDIYKGWLKKGPLTPKTLRSQSTIEKMSGVYVPFWLYDFEGESDMHASAERVRKERHGDTEYIYTDHYQVYRNVSAQFEKIPADASEKMEDDAMDKLEPFEYQDLVPFEMPYLSGYLSERYNFTDQDMMERVQSRVRNYITEITRNTITGYSSVHVLDNQISLDNKSNQYALLPVWMLNCRYQGKDFQFMLNGQTGKIVANRPISKGRAAAWWIGIFIVTFLVTLFF